MDFQTPASMTSRISILLTSLFFLILSASSLFAAETDSGSTLPIEYFLKNAVNHHPGVEQARAVIKSVKGEEFVFWSTILPQLRASATTPPVLINATINQKIYDYGTPARYRASQYGIAAAKANYELAVNEAIFDIRDAYAHALLGQKTRILVDAYAQELEHALKTVDLQFEAGKLTKNEVQRLYVRASLARKSAEDQRIQEAQLKYELFRLSGMKIQENITLKETESFQLPEVMDSTKLIEIAFQQRRDLYTLENVKLNAHEQIQILRSFNLPRLDVNIGSETNPGGLGFRTGYKSTYINSLEREDDLKADVFSKIRTDAVISWRIYDGGEIRGSLKQAQAEVIKQEALLQRVRIDIPSQVKAALQLLTLAHLQWQAISENDPQNTLDAAQEDFNAGKTKQLDLLDTQETVLSQRILKATAEANLSFSKASLDRATGLGIRFLSDPSIIKK